MRLALACLLFALACLPMASSASQVTPIPEASNFSLREWHSDDGLPSEDVVQLHQDREGFLWIACRSNLCRFDGTNFFRENTPENDDTFFALSEDRDGSLLIAPRRGNLFRFRGGRYLAETLPAPFTGQQVGGFQLAPDGSTWLSLRGAVLRLQGRELQSFGPEAGILDNSWTRFAVDKRGRVWLAGKQFLARYEDGALKRLRHEDYGDFLFIVPSHRGGPWLIAPDKVFKLDDNDLIERCISIPSLLGAHYIKAAIESRNGTLWLGSRSAGLHAIGEKGLFLVPTPSDSIMALCEDAEGTLWVGSSPGGLYAISPKAYNLYSKNSGLAATGVSAICEDREGSIWLANGDGGIACIIGQEIHHWTLPLDGRAISAGSVTRNPGGGIWATGGSGTAVFSLGANKAPPELVTQIPAGEARSYTFTDRRGDLWLTTSARRIGRLHQGVYQSYGPNEGVSPNGVRCFGEAEDGTLLAGTNDGSLIQFDGTRFVPALQPILAPGGITAIQGSGRWLFVGTASSGLHLFLDGRSAHLNTENGLPDNNILLVATDGKSAVWCGTSNAIFRLSLAELRDFLDGKISVITPVRLGRDEGLGMLNCVSSTGPGVARSSDGRLWFATRQGALAIDPDAQPAQAPAPIPRIEKVFVDDQELPLARPWVPSSSASKIEIQFSVLCLSTPSRVQTRCRLLGFDENWVRVKSGNTAAYPRLPPGNYRFEIAAGFGNEPHVAGDSLEIIIRPLWWQTLWFRLGSLLLVCLALVAAVRAWSHRRLRRRILRLERESTVAQVKERIARDIHDEVGASLTRISLLTQIEGNDSPEAEKFRRIDATAREVTRALDEIVWAVNPRHDSLEAFISYLSDYSQKFLEPAKIRCRLLIPASLPNADLSSEQRHNLFLCCREALNNVVKHAGATEVLIRLSETDGNLNITLCDNGVGLAGSTNASRDRTAQGNGLANMAERMRIIGGSCHLDSPAGGGTVVSLNIRIPRETKSLP